MNGKLREKLNRKLTVADALAFLSRRQESICLVVVCLFLLTPIIEMVICIFNPLERVYPLLHYPVIILNWVQPISVFLAALVYVGLIGRAVSQRPTLRGQWAHRRAYLFFFLMVLWILLSSVVTKTTAMWRYPDSYRNEPTSLVVAYFLVFFFCASRIRSPERKEQIAGFTILLSMLLGIYSTVNYYLVSSGKVYRMQLYSVAVFFQHNHYGYYLAIHTMLSCGLFALSGRKAFRAVGLAGLILNTAVLTMNNTFGAWFACVVTFVFQFIVIRIVKRRASRRTLIGFGVFLAVTLLNSIWAPQILHSFLQFFLDIDSIAKDPRHSDSAGTGRWQLWKYTFAWIAERPVFGFGNEGTSRMLKELTGSSRPHNEFLQYAVFYGIPAAVLYVCGVLSVFLNGYRSRATLNAPTLLCLIGAFAYLFSSLFGNTMFYTAPFFFLFLGLGYDRCARQA